MGEILVQQLRYNTFSIDKVLRYTEAELEKHPHLRFPSSKGAYSLTGPGLPSVILKSRIERTIDLTKDFFLKLVLLFFVYTFFLGTTGYACTRCWERSPPGETFDFSKGNYPKGNKSEIKVESENQKKLVKDCQSGNSKACEELRDINEQRIKSSAEAPLI